jgi:glycosyltransferase involved in cell wall biosynthesis
LAGLEYSSKDWIMIMDADFQDPPSLIYDLYTHALSDHYDVVLAQRTSRSDGWFKDRTAWAFYRTINFLSDVTIPRDV